MCVVVLLPLEQLRVPPLHEGVQVDSGRRRDADQVSVGPDLQAHQGDEGPQRLVDLGESQREKGHFLSERPREGS